MKDDSTGTIENCETVPSQISSFVDTFVDFVVGGQCLGPQPQSFGSSGTRVSPNAEENFVTKETNVVTRLPAPERLIAIGDIHGDLAKAREALRIAQVIDEKDRWIGGDTVVVQVGDLLDRGGEELKVIYLLEKLSREAKRQGGAVHVMNGNHEIMNIEGDFRFATSAGQEEFRRWAHWFNLGNAIKEQCGGLKTSGEYFRGIPEHFPDGLKSRMAALRPGGPISSRFLSSHSTVLVVGGTVFAHGGLLPTHIHHGLEKMNEEVQQWILGKRGWHGPRYLHGQDAVVWSRKYSIQQESACDCDVLEKALGAITGAKRMVVGHTIQHSLGINAVCNNQVVRVDVGMSKGCGNAAPEVLEICRDQELRVLSSQSSLKLMSVDDIQQYQNQQKPGLASLLSTKSEGKLPAKIHTVS